MVLVGHGLRTDLLVLRRRGIRFEEVKTVIGILDTTYIARDLLGINFRLEALLKFLLYPIKNIHLPGNDANYTLRVLLLLAYYGLRSSHSSAQVILTLTTFKKLGQEPLPDSTQRNALLRLSKPRSEYFDIDGIEEGGIFAILDSTGD